MSDDNCTRKRSRTVVVTGAAGFIGSHLVDALVEHGFAVRAFDNLATGSRANLNPRADFIEADIRDRAPLDRSFKGADCVLHAAALPRVGLSIEKPAETHLTNAVGTLNVLLAARDAGVPRVIYSSSSSVYGQQERMPLDESMVPNPLSPYALQKLVGEQYARMFHRLYGLGTLCLRYFSVYGPRMDMVGAYATVIGAFLRARMAGRPLEIRGDGEQTRDFTHVRDVVRANLAAVDCALADGSALNIGRGHGLSVNHIAAIVGGPCINAAPRPGEPRDTLADIARSRAVLGWRPEVEAEDGVRELMRLHGV